MTPPSLVPSFFLFGEPPREVGARFLHLEPLDHRARPSAWNIRPHVHQNLCHLFHLTGGGGEMTADGLQLAFEAPCLIVVPAGAAHGFGFAPETAGTVLTLSRAYLGEITSREAELSGLFARPATARLTGTEAADSLERLSRELAWRAPGHGAAVEAHLIALLVEALRRLRLAASRPDTGQGRQAALVARFRTALERHLRERMSIDGYAAELGVSTGRLRAACLAMTGASPLHLVEERTILEARRALLYSNMTVAEAGYQLGFDDPAYFTRFFTKATGESPRAFRRRQAF